MIIFLVGAQITFDVIVVAMFLAFILTYDHLFDRWVQEFGKMETRQAQQEKRLVKIEKIERGTTEFNKAELDAFIRSLNPPPDGNIQDC